MLYKSRITEAVAIGAIAFELFNPFSAPHYSETARKRGDGYVDLRWKDPDVLDFLLMDVREYGGSRKFTVRIPANQQKARINYLDPEKIYSFELRSCENKRYGKGYECRPPKPLF